VDLPLPTIEDFSFDGILKAVDPEGMSQSRPVGVLGADERGSSENTGRGDGAVHEIPGLAAHGGRPANQHPDRAHSADEIYGPVRDTGLEHYEEALRETRGGKLRIEGRGRGGFAGRSRRSDTCDHDICRVYLASH
jgi:hypothetical protein